MWSKFARIQIHGVEWWKVCKKPDIYEIFASQNSQPQPPSKSINFTPQNYPSIYATHCLDLQPNDVVLDMCAAPGGKTSHIFDILSAFSETNFQLIAVEKSKNRFQKLKNLPIWKNSKFAEQVKILNKDSSKLPENRPEFVEKFDKILLDAPCSATGQRPRKPMDHTKKSVEDYVILQRNLFEAAVQMLKPGGILVYSTCSIRAEENAQNVTWFEQKFGDHLISLQAKPNCLEPSQSTQGCKIYDPWKVCEINEQENLSSTQLIHMKKLESLEQDTIGFFVSKFMKKKLKNVKGCLGVMTYVVALVFRVLLKNIGHWG